VLTYGLQIRFLAIRLTAIMPASDIALARIESPAGRLEVTANRTHSRLILPNPV
jgi:hypothetical protein